MASRGVCAGRWPAVAGSRPAAGATRRSMPCVDGVRALACSEGSAPKAIGLIPPGMDGTGGSAGRWRAITGSRPAAGPTRRSTLYGDGVRVLACSKGSDPKAIGLIPPGMAGTGGSAGRWPAVAGSRPAAGATRRSIPCVDGVRALACSEGSDPKAIGLIPPGMPAQGVVPAAGRQLREAGQRPALPGDPRHAWMGSHPTRRRNSSASIGRPRW